MKIKGQQNLYPASCSHYIAYSCRLPIIFTRIFNIYNHAVNPKGGGGSMALQAVVLQSCALYFNLNRKGTVLCFSPLPFYYCLANGNTSNKCSTRAIHIKVDLSIWEKWEQDCSLLAQIWHWQMKRWDSITLSTTWAGSPRAILVPAMFFIHLH